MLVCDVLRRLDRHFDQSRHGQRPLEKIHSLPALGIGALTRVSGGTRSPSGHREHIGGGLLELGFGLLAQRSASANSLSWRATAATTSR